MWTVFLVRIVVLPSGPHKGLAPFLMLFSFFGTPSLQLGNVDSLTTLDIQTLQKRLQKNLDSFLRAEGGLKCPLKLLRIPCLASITYGMRTTMRVDMLTEYTYIFMH
eukprot:scaffold10354_cov18-Tisochrysis_lutea.AAC.3